MPTEGALHTFFVFVEGLPEPIKIDRRFPGFEGGKWFDLIEGMAAEIARQGVSTKSLPKSLPKWRGKSRPAYYPPHRIERVEWERKPKD